MQSYLRFQDLAGFRKPARSKAIVNAQIIYSKKNDMPMCTTYFG
jgi:hypothetical protein